MVHLYLQDSGQNNALVNLHKEVVQELCLSQWPPPSRWELPASAAPPSRRCAAGAATSGAPREQPAPMAPPSQRGSHRWGSREMLHCALEGDENVWGQWIASWRGSGEITSEGGGLLSSIPRGGL
jgi:hypothetical protein